MRLELISLHTNRALSTEPAAVLVFLVFDSHLIWVRHPKRGWEVPGGKVEAGELPEDAARREVWEETGARVTKLEWLAEYYLADAQGTKTAKWAYIARVDDIGARPAKSEIIDVKVMRPSPSPQEAQRRPDISYIMKDAMYAELWPIVTKHPLMDTK